MLSGNADEEKKMETQEPRKEGVMSVKKRLVSMSNTSGGTSKLRNTEFVIEAMVTWTE